MEKGVDGRIKYRDGRTDVDGERVLFAYYSGRFRQTVFLLLRNEGQHINKMSITDGCQGNFRAIFSSVFLLPAYTPLYLYFRRHHIHILYPI